MGDNAHRLCSTEPSGVALREVSPYSEGVVVGDEMGVPAHTEPVTAAERAPFFFDSPPPCHLVGGHPSASAGSCPRSDADSVCAAEGYGLPHPFRVRVADVPSAFLRQPDVVPFRGTVDCETIPLSGQEYSHGDVCR